MFPEALRQDLESAQVTTVLWSIDGTLRYIPIAALHDGKQYLVAAGFRNAILTSAGLTGGVNRPSSGSTKGLGFGVSKAMPDFVPLPGVQAEMGRIFQAEGTPDRPLTGLVRLDENFTMEALMGIRTQTNENKAVVHIATHFDARPGVAENSRLLLGDGTQTLKQIEGVSRLFSGVDLLTLSACSTAYSGSGSDGHEVDGLGTIAQDLGANTVIASLWSVSDEATSRLMETMYRNRGQKLGKSDALKQAQQQMASGALKPRPAAVGERRFEVTGAPPPPVATGWTHPYYWAAFILIGNWK